MAVNYLALSGAHAARSRVTGSWISADLDVSVVESRGDDTPRFRISTPSSLEQPSQYLDSSAPGSGATLYSDYQRLEQEASALKTARGREIQGGATPPPPRSSTDVAQKVAATDRDVEETDTSLTLNFDPLHAYGVMRDTGSGMEPGRGGYAGGRGGSAAGRVRFIANSTSSMSGPDVSANTDGLQVHWSSRSASSCGIVPTNLFGGADASSQPSADAPNSCMPGEIDFLRQVPDSQVEQHCRSLLN